MTGLVHVSLDIIDKMAEGQYGTAEQILIVAPHRQSSVRRDGNSKPSSLRRHGYG